MLSMWVAIEITTRYLLETPGALLFYFFGHEFCAITFHFFLFLVLIVLFPFILWKTTEY